jgi:hypothetical protein
MPQENGPTDIKTSGSLRLSSLVLLDASQSQSQRPSCTHACHLHCMSGMLKQQLINDASHEIDP